MQKANALIGSCKKELVFFFIASLAVVVDQLSKLLVRAYMTPGQSIPSQGLIRLTYTTNSGAAFGLLANQTFLLILATATGIMALLLYFRYLSLENPWLRVGLGLVLGGAVGNLVDRLLFGHVVDFIDFWVWPIFNLADSAIAIGIVILGCFLWFSARKS